MKISYNFKNATREDVKEYKAEVTLSTAVTSSSYNTFLDKVVTDQGFKDALAGVGVSILLEQITGKMLQALLMRKL